MECGFPRTPNFLKSAPKIAFKRGKTRVRLKFNYGPDPRPLAPPLRIRDRLHFLDVDGFRMIFTKEFIHDMYATLIGSIAALNFFQIRF